MNNTVKQLRFLLIMIGLALGIGALGMQTAKKDSTLTISEKEKKECLSQLSERIEPREKQCTLPKALQEAAKTDDVDTVRAFLAEGGDTEAGDQLNTTMLNLAAAHKAPKVFRLLLEENADIDTSDMKGWRPLMHLSYNSGEIPDSMLEELLVLSPSLNVKDGTGWNPMMIAASMKNLQAMQRLYKAGFEDIQAATDQGWTALHYAAFEGFLPGVKLLVGWGADPAARTNDERTPLEGVNNRETKEADHKAVIEYLESISTPRSTASTVSSVPSVSSTASTPSPDED